MSYCEATWLAVKTPAGLICPPIVELGFFPVLGPVSRKSRELFGFEKPFVKLRPGCSVKLIFSHVVKGIRIKITAKFRASRRLRFEDTKRIMLLEIRPKSFGAFENQAPDLFYFTRAVVARTSRVTWFEFFVLLTESLCNESFNPLVEYSFLSKTYLLWT